MDWIRGIIQFSTLEISFSWFAEFAGKSTPGEAWG